MTPGSSQFIAPPDHFISRVSSIPIVNSALRFYEQSKANSKVVKYSAETVENLCKPVLNKLEPRLGSFLDEFGCRQLDSLGRRYPSLMGRSSSPSSDDETRDIDFEDLDPHVRDTGNESSMVVATNIYGVRDSSQHWENRQDLRKRKNDKSSREEQDYTPDDNTDLKNAVSLSSHSIAPRSRWEQYLVEASTAAGAGAAAFSEESMKALKYCLQWLQYATVNIDRQISLLRQFLVSAADSSNSSSTVVTVNTTSTLSHIKREVIETLRKVVDVVQRYAGACLPGEARRRVRNFILNLPWRWASLNSQSLNTSPLSSPLLTPTSPHSNPHLNINESAQMVLTFATESLIMLQSVVGIFKDTVERAEGWIERLRTIGVGSSTECSDEDVYMLDPPGDAHISPDKELQSRSDMDMD
ncbi:transcription factor Opi1 [Basidiobolus meristosporus CBS 931.73]|uniref:Transcription factor Opi1 n=1 Tax=Basidiobolus meristosporus CBS 931.73 TaxID=1314790 RepID=A0A1Y1X3D7_9FUNG|nr:transcription factor Opi1 [Basidiobolus meristosporus CBS 931.73]|eukprot:ORX80293.1 transcription factor Opi1 [Basidiobolus meristosporus CBS 931.73]